VLAGIQTGWGGGGGGGGGSLIKDLGAADQGGADQGGEVASGGKCCSVCLLAKSSGEGERERVLVRRGWCVGA